MIRRKGRGEDNLPRIGVRHCQSGNRCRGTALGGGIPRAIEIGNIPVEDDMIACLRNASVRPVRRIARRTGCRRNPVIVLARQRQIHNRQRNRRSRVVIAARKTIRTDDIVCDGRVGFRHECGRNRGRARRNDHRHRLDIRDAGPGGFMRGRKLRIDREFVRRSVSARNRHLAGYEFKFFRIADLGERERARIKRIDTVGARSRGALGKETDAIRGIRGKLIGRKRNRRFAVDRRSRSFKDKFVRAVVDNDTRPHGINRTDCRLGRVRAITVMRQCELGKRWCAGKAKLNDVACRTRERKFVDLEISALRLIAAGCEVEQIRRARAGIVDELRFYRTVRFKRRIVICSVLDHCIYKFFSVRSRIAVDAQVAKKRRVGRVIHQVVGAHAIRRKRIFRTHDEERNLVRTARNAPNRKTGRTSRISIAVTHRTILRGGG